MHFKLKFYLRAFAIKSLERDKSDHPPTFKLKELFCLSIIDILKPLSLFAHGCDILLSCIFSAFSQGHQTAPGLWYEWGAGCQDTYIVYKHQLETAGSWHHGSTFCTWCKLFIAHVLICRILLSFHIKMGMVRLFAKR